MGWGRRTYSIDGVELPLGVELEAVGVDILVEGESDLDPEVHEHETLGADLEGQNFDGVGDEETRPRKRIGDGEDPDHSDDGTASGDAALCLLGRANRPNNEGNAHGASCSQEERATSEAIDHHSAGHGNNERQDGETAVETKLGIGISYANALEDLLGVVGDKTVTRALGEDTEGGKKHQPVPVALGLQEIEVGGSLLVHELQAEGLLDFLVFELDGGVVSIAVGMVFGQDSESLLVALLADQPTRGLGDPEDEGELDNRRSSLGQGRQTPCPISTDTLGTECQPGTDDGTNIPEAVVDGGNTATMLRMAQLGKQKRRGQLGQRVAKTHEEAASHEVVEVLSSSLNGSTNDHNDTADGNRSLTAKVIRNEGSNGKRGDRTDRVESSEDTKETALRIAHLVVEVIQNTEVVQHRTAVR